MEFPVSSTVLAPHAVVVRGAQWTRVAFPVRYGLFEHPREGLVLIDTGYTAALNTTAGLLLKAYRTGLRPQLVSGAGRRFTHE